MLWPFRAVGAGPLVFGTVHPSHPPSAARRSRHRSSKKPASELPPCTHSSSPTAAAACSCRGAGSLPISLGRSHRSFVSSSCTSSFVAAPSALPPKTASAPPTTDADAPYRADGGAVVASSLHVEVPGRSACVAPLHTGLDEVEGSQPPKYSARRPTGSYAAAPPHRDDGGTPTTSWSRCQVA